MNFTLAERRRLDLIRTAVRRKRWKAWGMFVVGFGVGSLCGYQYLQFGKQLLQTSHAFASSEQVSNAEVFFSCELEGIMIRFWLLAVGFGAMGGAGLADILFGWRLASRDELLLRVIDELQRIDQGSSARVEGGSAGAA